MCRGATLQHHTFFGMITAVCAPQRTPAREPVRSRRAMRTSRPRLPHSHPCTCSAVAQLTLSWNAELPSSSMGHSCRYVGEWRAGQAEGYGVMQTAAGGRWEGPWRGGARHGRGVAVSDCGAADFQSFDAGRLVLGEWGPPGPCPANAPIRCARSFSGRGTFGAHHMARAVH